MPGQSSNPTVAPTSNVSADDEPLDVEWARLMDEPGQYGERVDGFRNQMLRPLGNARDLVPLLERRYGIKITDWDLVENENGVIRIDRASGCRWTATVFPPAWSFHAVQDVAEILLVLERRRFPAERLACARPVSKFRDRPVLMTEFVEKAEPPHNWSTFHDLGKILGEMHSLQPETAAMNKPGGAWNMIYAQGTPWNEKNMISRLVAEIEHHLKPQHITSWKTMCEELCGIDDCLDLPHAFTHQSFTPLSVNATDHGLVVVDWAGAGRGPRLTALGDLLWHAHGLVGNMSHVDAVIEGYTLSVSLEPREIARLAGAIRFRHVTSTCWGVIMGVKRLTTIPRAMNSLRASSEEIAVRARQKIEQCRRRTREAA